MQDTLVFGIINFKFLLKLKVHHLGKFAPRENNLPYGIWDTEDNS